MDLGIPITFLVEVLQAKTDTKYGLTGHIVTENLDFK